MIKVKCNCGGEFREQTVEFEGFDVKGLKCSKCGELTFTPEQFRKILALKELAKEVNSTRKVVKIGNSLGITLPKAINALGLKVGSKIALRLEDRKRLQLVVA
ncbi:MAG: hypothetical protein HYW05_01075 [Candidatus Diapherotrites archaeon]|nr:hypothetical protein [Candidatus Diapherotrites archaeon]